ncbi:MAG TPA: histidine phosphatase family protein [Chlamydiales bacterium]|nr:histidine phosphatase family protein [Chlamydiales bacterium]
MRIVLCRHGETQWSRSGQHTSFSDIPLTQTGESQAKDLRQKLSKINVSQVYTSPMQRAKRTCELAGFSNFLIEPLAVEWNYGTYEGLTTPEIWNTNPNWNVFLNGAPGGETPDQVACRADQLIEKWTRDKKDILLFSHAHFLRTLAARWIYLSPAAGRNFGLTVASISVLGFERNQRIIESWNN